MAEAWSAARAAHTAKISTELELRRIASKRDTREGLLLLLLLLEELLLRLLSECVIVWEMSGPLGDRGGSPPTVRRTHLGLVVGHLLVEMLRLCLEHLLVLSPGKLVVLCGSLGKVARR